VRKSKITTCFIIVMNIFALSPPSFSSIRGRLFLQEELVNRIQDSVPANPAEPREVTHFTASSKTPPRVGLRSTEVKLTDARPVGISLDTIFDRTAAILTSAPISSLDTAEALGVSIVIDNHDNKFSTIQNLNSQARIGFLEKHPHVKDSAFLFLAMPVDVLHRYDGVFTPQEICTEKNIRWIPKSNFKFSTLSFEEAQKDAVWEKFFEDLPAKVDRQKQFEEENIIRQSHQISENPRFTELCSSWENYFRTHQNATKLELIQEQKLLDKVFSDILHSDDTGSSKNEEG
jgi:hypothetical protein